MHELKQMPKEERMVKKQDILDILHSYNLDEARIGMVASHSALDLADGAIEEGFKTVAICKKGREKTYLRYKRIINTPIILEKFDQLLKEDTQKELRDEDVLFVPNRSLTAYVPVEKIEKDFYVPMFGNRYMLKTDEREYQYQLFKDAGISYPMRFESYKDIDRLCMVKVPEAKRKIERAFFMCASPEEFLKKWEARVHKNILSEEQLKSNKIWVEEYIIGAQFNFNYFYSPLKKELEFLGIDRRIQTDIDVILRLPADDQIGRNLTLQNIEIGHESATIRESMLEKVYDVGEKFVAASKRNYPPGIIGPFALQGAVTPDLEIVIYDLSPRMPGSPVLYSSPYSKYYFGYPVTSGHRVAMEIKEAIKTDEVDKIIT